MAINSRAKGKAGENELCHILRPLYPDICRNLDQFGPLKMDHLNTPGVHLQSKRVERINIWDALDQTITESAPTDLPVLAFRRNWNRSSLPSRSSWFGALELDELVALLRLREQS